MLSHIRQDLDLQVREPDEVVGTELGWQLTAHLTAPFLQEEVFEILMKFCLCN